MATTERCDRCGGKPSLRFERDGRSLILCARHGRQHGRVMREAGWFTYRIVELAQT